MTAFSLEYSVIDRTPGKKNKFPVDLDLDLNGEVTFADFVNKIRIGHILIAREVLKEEQRLGFDPNPKILVDRRKSSNESSVKPFGRIEYYAKLADLEILLEVYRKILDRSPKRTGQYLQSNYVLVNERPIARTYQEFAKFVELTKKEGLAEIQSVRFLNVTPYAARLEYTGTRSIPKGKNKGSQKSKRRFGKSRQKKSLGKQIKKPNGAYYLASRTLGNTKGFFDRVKFEFIPNGYKGISIDPQGQFRTSYIDSVKNRAKRRVGKPYVYPSIVFNLSKIGLVRQWVVFM